MKIAMIHGQSHKGISYHLGRILVNKLEKEENITEFFLPKDMPKFCLGCYNCLIKGEEYCPHYEYLKPITEAIDNADLLVFTTPVYCLRTTGSMKALLDHYFTRFIVHRAKEEMYLKRAVVISVGAGTGMRQAAADIKSSLFYWGISNIDTYKLRSAAFSWDDISEDKKIKIEKDLTSLAKNIKNNLGKEKVSLKSKAIFYLMRKAQQNGASSCEKDSDYWRDKGWLDKKRPWKRENIK